MPQNKPEEKRLSSKVLIYIIFLFFSVTFISSVHLAWANQDSPTGLYKGLSGSYQTADKQQKEVFTQEIDQYEYWSPNDFSGAHKKTSNYVLGPGDRIKVIVFGEESLSGEFVVNDAGFIAMPLIGDLLAQGETINGVEEMIVDHLSPDYIIHPSVSIEIEARPPFYVLGEVRQPGSYDYIDNISALKAVATAGGFTYRARQKDIVIIRTEEGVKKKHKSMPLETTLRPGDVVYVEERFF